MHACERHRNDGAEQVKKRADIADEDAFVRFGIFLCDKVDQIVIVPFGQLFVVQSLIGSGVIALRLIEGEGLKLFALLLQVFKVVHRGTVDRDESAVRPFGSAELIRGLRRFRFAFSFFLLLI